MDIILRNICKSYPRKKVLSNVSLSFAQGQVHAIYGENGAGKSTLVNILAGNTQCDSGEILLNQKKVKFNSAKDALEHGIVLVHQTPLLAPELTAEENILLLKKISRDNVKKMFSQWAPNIDRNTKVQNLSGNKKFYVALIRELLKEPKVLILDEPSAFLNLEERKSLYTKLKKLAESGTNIIVITHSTAEASTYCDTVSVLQDGKVVNTEPKATYSNNEMPLMQSSHLKKITFALEHVYLKPKHLAPLNDINIQVSEGTISAVTGIQEASMETLELFVTGMIKDCEKKGSVFLHGTKLTLPKEKFSASLLRRHKAAIVPSDRKYVASNPNLSIEQMLFSAGKSPEQCIADAGINITKEEKVSALSGGMLQRLILEREKSLGGNLFILCNPMQGLDTKSQAALISTIFKLTSEGKSILVIGATDIPLSTCTRVYNLEEGTCTLAFQKQTF